MSEGKPVRDTVPALLLKGEYHVSKKVEEKIGKELLDKLNTTEDFIRRLLNPEDMGFAVTPYVRDEARKALGMKAVENCEAIRAKKKAVITVHFSECCIIHDQPGIPAPLTLPFPLQAQCLYLEGLLEGTNSGTFTTYNEHFLLIAQYLKRTKGKNFVFVSWCNCTGTLRSRRIELDDEGDMPDDPHHNFFSQRLKYLR